MLMIGSVNMKTLKSSFLICKKNLVSWLFRFTSYLYDLMMTHALKDKTNKYYSYRPKVGKLVRASSNKSIQPRSGRAKEQNTGSSTDRFRLDYLVWQRVLQLDVQLISDDVLPGYKHSWSIHDAEAFIGKQDSIEPGPNIWTFLQGRHQFRIWKRVLDQGFQPV